MEWVALSVELEDVLWYVMLDKRFELLLPAPSSVLDFWFGFNLSFSFNSFRCSLVTFLNSSFYTPSPDWFANNSKLSETVDASKSIKYQISNLRSQLEQLPSDSWSECINLDSTNSSQPRKLEPSWAIRFGWQFLWVRRCIFRRIWLLIKICKSNLFDKRKYNKVRPQSRKKACKSIKKTSWNSI